MDATKLDHRELYAAFQIIWCMWRKAEDCKDSNAEHFGLALFTVKRFLDAVYPEFTKLRAEFDADKRDFDDFLMVPHTSERK